MPGTKHKAKASEVRIFVEERAHGASDAPQRSSKFKFDSEELGLFCGSLIHPQACRRSTVSPPRAATAAIDEATAVADMEHMPMDVDYPGI
eukprot:20742-Heterococcus_DN1.PRE.1